jgi:hypothetical protein
VSAEGAELVGPERLDLVQPGAQVGERLLAQPVDAGAGIGLVAGLLDEAAAAQDAEVAAHRRRAHRERGGELAGAVRARAQEIDHAAAGRIGQRREGGVDALHQAPAAGSGIWKIQRWPSGSSAR